MKNKKVLIITVVITLLVICSVLLYFKLRGSTIYLDINPSIEIKITNNEDVISVTALNEDANDIISNEFVGKTFENVLNLLAKSLIDKGYVDDGKIAIIAYATGNIKKDDIKWKIANNFESEGIYVDVFVIDKITKEDEELAHKYNITPSKAAYINSVIKENDKIDFEYLVDKSASEINEILFTGNYCEDGYTLNGDFCKKELDRVAAINDDICPSDTYFKDDKCYQITIGHETEEFYCMMAHEELRGKECYFKEVSEPEYRSFECPTGKKELCGRLSNDPESEWDKNCYICITKYEFPTYACVKKINGKCYQGPGKPHIDGKCLNGDIDIGGKCYEYKKYDYKCSDGVILPTEDTYCPNLTEYVRATPTDPFCQDGYKLEGDKCVFESITLAKRKMGCEDGYTLVDNDSCVDFNHEVDKINGYRCDNEKYEVKGNYCILYDIVKAKHY